MAKGKGKSLLNSMAKMAVTGAFLLALTYSAQAQSQNNAPERGFHAGGSYALSEIETISRASGELSINLPLGALPPGRGGLAAKLSLLYSSKLWDTFEGVACSAQGMPADESVLIQSQDGGWRYGYQYYLKLDLFKIPPSEDYCNGVIPPDYCNSGITHPYQLVLVTPDGGQHKLWLDGHTDTDGFQNIWPDGTPACPGQTGETGTLTYYSTDSSFLRLDIAHDGDNDWSNNAWTLYLPDGTRVLGGTIAGSNAFQRIIDRNGNYLELRNVLADPNYNNHKTTYITDQLNRSIVLEQEYAVNQDAIHVKGTNGVEKLWLVEWRNIVVRKTYHRSDFNPSAALNKTIRVVDKIFLPAQAGNLFYTFDYNANTTNNPSFGWGELSSVTLPSGASASYGYLSDGTNGSSIYPVHILRNRPKQKTLSYNDEYDGITTPVAEVWTYDTTFADASSTVVTETRMTGPDGGVSKEYPNRGSNGGYFAGETNKTENPDGTVVERFYTANIPQGLPSFMTLANRFVKYEFVSIRNSQDNLSKTAIKEFSYDKNGNATQVNEYDWVAYTSVPRDVYGQPTGLPGGATPARVTVNTFYSPTPDAADSTTFDADIYSKSTSPRLKNAIQSSEVRAASGTSVSRSESFYDDATTTGNLTSAKSWDSTKGAISRPLTGSNSLSVSYQYDAFGNLTLSTDARGIQSQLSYGNVGGFTSLYPTQTVVALGTAIARTTTKEYDFNTGLVRRVTDVDNNVSTATTYDVFGRPTLVAAAEGKPEETHTRSEYSDSARRVITRSDQITKDDGRLVSIQHYDQLGRLRLARQLEDAATQNANDETTGIKTQSRYRFSGLNAYTLTSNPYRAATSGAASGETTMGWSRTKRDNGGRLIEVETFNGASLPAPWGSNSSSSGVVLTQYDANTTTVTDQANKARRSVTDALGRLTEVIEDPNGLNYSTTYQYNLLDDLVKVQQGNQRRYFLYDSLKRLMRSFNPEQAANPAITVADPLTMNSQWNTAYSYDNNANLIQEIEARNITTNYVYDNLNRITERSYTNDPQNTPAVTYRYEKDAQGNAIANARGRLTAIINSVSATEYLQFDAFGRIKQSRQTTNVTGASYTYPVSYDYNLAGALRSETYPSGRVINTTYDTAGRISEVSGVKASQTTTYASQFVYTAHGAVASMKVGNDPANPRYEHTNFNARLQPTQIGLGTGPTSISLLGLNYTYGVVVGGTLDPTKNNGNIESQTINVISGTMLKQSYGYDALNRLTSVNERVNNESTPRWTQQYTFDRFSNRTGLTNSGDERLLLPTQSTPAVDATSNRLSAAQYDDAGNLLNDGVTNKIYSYDGENRLVNLASHQPATYGYDGDGRRVTRSIKGALSTWVTYVQVYDAGGRMIAEYSSGSGLGGQTTSPKYITTDHLGSTRLVTKADGSVKARYDYLPFGEELGAGIGTRNTTMMYTSTDATRQKFTGHERDAESGLDFMEARYCSSMSGRFMSADSVAGSPSNPQSLNLYCYVMNNPMKYTDPTGHAVENQQQQTANQPTPPPPPEPFPFVAVTLTWNEVQTLSGVIPIINPVTQPISSEAKDVLEILWNANYPIYYEAAMQEVLDSREGSAEISKQSSQTSVSGTQEVQKTDGIKGSGTYGGDKPGTLTGEYNGSLAQKRSRTDSQTNTNEYTYPAQLTGERQRDAQLINNSAYAFGALQNTQINAPKSISISSQGATITSMGTRALSAADADNLVLYVNQQARIAARRNAQGDASRTTKP